jgi:hypothetical protein
MVYFLVYIKNNIYFLMEKRVLDLIYNVEKIK